MSSEDCTQSIYLFQRGQFLRAGKDSSMLKIRVGVLHLFKFDMEGVQCWRGFNNGGLA